MSPPDADEVPTVVAPATSGPFPVGAILGSYRLLQQIGAGGMGRVFVAEHIHLGRKVAMKVLRSELSGNIEAVKRFFAEARAVNRIKHENIIEISDFVADPHGPSFYIMELLHGIELRVLANREGALPIERALRIVIQVCRGVGAAHAAGVIHRDLKPDNIFLTEREGRPDFVKLLDFGVAKLTSATLDDASTYMTTAGMVVGTPDYMAPEQALGQVVDRRADIYSLGVILFELVAGRRPFVARTAREVMIQHMVTPPPRPGQLNPASPLPAELEDLILGCLQKDPGARPDSIHDVERRLQDILDRRPPVPGSDRPGVRLTGRKPGRRWPIVAAAALLAIAAGLLAWSHGGQRKVRGANASARPTVSAPTTSTAPSSTAQGAAAALAGTPGLTIEPAVSGLHPEATTATGLVAAPAAAASQAPARSPPVANPRRRKAIKLDRDAVVNPFE
jgi:serine/threonine-protein kinase